MSELIASDKHTEFYVITCPKTSFGRKTVSI